MHRLCVAQALNSPHGSPRALLNMSLFPEFIHFFLLLEVIHASLKKKKIASALQAKGMVWSSSTAFVML